ncbi:hypothetical protein Tco_0112074 [Tanacetum coccineum]
MGQVSTTWRGTVGAGYVERGHLVQVATTLRETGRAGLRRSEETWFTSCDGNWSSRYERARNRRGRFTSCEESWPSRYDVRGTVGAGLRRARKVGQVATTCEEPSGQVYVVRGKLAKSLRRARNRPGQSLRRARNRRGKVYVRAEKVSQVATPTCEELRAGIRRARNRGQVAYDCETTVRGKFTSCEQVSQVLRRAKNVGRILGWSTTGPRTMRNLESDSQVLNPVGHQEARDQNSLPSASSYPEETSEEPATRRFDYFTPLYPIRTNDCTSVSLAGLHQRFPLASPRSGIVQTIFRVPQGMLTLEHFSEESSRIGGAYTPRGSAIQLPCALLVYSPVDIAQTSQTLLVRGFKTGRMGCPQGRWPGARKVPKHAVDGARWPTHDRRERQSPRAYPTARAFGPPQQSAPVHSTAPSARPFSSFPSGNLLAIGLTASFTLDGIYRPISAAFPNTHSAITTPTWCTQGPEHDGLSTLSGRPLPGLGPVRR